MKTSPGGLPPLDNSFYFPDGELVRLDQRVQLKPKDVRLVGDDIRVIATLVESLREPCTKSTEKPA